jgi:hypothetical protein
VLRSATLTATLLVACLLVTGEASAATLTWPRPALVNPVTIDMTTARTYYNLDPARDYKLRLPPTVYDRGGIVIEGGRNVTLIGGRISVPETGATTLGPRRGLLLNNQRGTMYVEGLVIDGAGLSEGIQMDQRYGATVRLQNNYVGTTRARDEAGFSDNHPDVLQTWAGPKLLQVDRLSGASDYQGLFLAPTQKCSTDACKPSTTADRRWDLRNIDVRGTASARYLAWKEGAFPLNQREIYVTPAAGRSMAATLWPNVAAWPGVKQSTLTAPRFAPPSGLGLGYPASAQQFRY